MKTHSIGLTALILFIVMGCATSSKTRVSPPNTQGTPQVALDGKPPIVSPDVYGPPVPEAPPSYGPEPTEVKPIVLVLGPGLARGFAYIGVVRALHDAKIPIAAIYGTEMGGLIGSLYAMSTSINQFEWGLLKFKEDTFIKPKGFLSSLTEGDYSKGEKLETALRQVFGAKDLASSKVRTSIGVLNRDTGTPVALDKGEVSALLRATLAAPELFSPVKIHLANSEMVGLSPASVRPFLIQEAKASGLGPIVVVDVLSDAEEKMAYDELKLADLVIRPEMKGISSQDFKKKTEAAFRGKSAIIQHMPEIKRQIGSAYP